MSVLGPSAMCLRSLVYSSNVPAWGPCPQARPQGTHSLQGRCMSILGSSKTKTVFKLRLINSFYEYSLSIYYMCEIDISIIYILHSFIGFRIGKRLVTCSIKPDKPVTLFTSRIKIIFYKPKLRLRF